MEPAKDATGTLINNFPMSEGSVRTGHYINTTRNETDQLYTYMWNHKCYFKTYTPSNQYLAKYGRPTTEVDYSHFGMIGHEKDCFWGLFGVQWVKPMPVFQEHAALKAHYGKLHGNYTS